MIEYLPKYVFPFQMSPLPPPLTSPPPQTLSPTIPEIISIHQIPCHITDILTLYVCKSNKTVSCYFLYVYICTNMNTYILYTYIHIYSWFHISGTWRVNSFNGDYLSIPEGTCSCGYLFFIKSPVSVYKCVNMDGFLMCFCKKKTKLNVCQFLKLEFPRKSK